jgi:hypothetical protein
MKTRIAAVQMVSGPDIAQNLRDAGRLIAEAAADGAQLVALPEYFPLISANETDKVRAREREGAGPLQDFLREAAVRHRVWLVGGSIPLEAGTPDKVRNSCLVFDADGRSVARYDKIHLFGFQRGTEQYNESQTIEAGPGWRPSIHPSAASACRYATTCAFPSCTAPWGQSTCWWCRRRSPLPPARPTGSCCCARGRWRTSATCWPRPRAACTRADARPGATACWSTPGARCSKRLPDRAWRGDGEIDPARIADLRASLPALRTESCEPMNPIQTPSFLATAESRLLAPFDLSTPQLETVFGELYRHRLDYADLYFQYSRSEAWSLEEGIVKSGSFNIESGVGVRAISGEKTAFAYSDEISLPALKSAAQATRAIAAQGGQQHVPLLSGRAVPALYGSADPLASLPDTEKVRLLERLEGFARAEDAASSR